jgi:DNA-binding transcriptional regulator PaaX
VRLRDIAGTLGITERTAFAIVTDLTEAGYIAKDKDGRRNRYRIQDHLPAPEAEAFSRIVTNTVFKRRPGSTTGS